MMLSISFVLGIIPLAGIAWTVSNGMITTVDGLFMSHILLALAGIFFMNAFCELRERAAKENAPPTQKNELI